MFYYLLKIGKLRQNVIVSWSLVTAAPFTLQLGITLDTTSLLPQLGSLIHLFDLSGPGRHVSHDSWP